jgi:hypothetical protein
MGFFVFVFCYYIESVFSVEVKQATSKKQAQQDGDITFLRNVFEHTGPHGVTSQNVALFI